jgi:isopentenyl diphosphate isomerase/L-lactate dehydrogenase-like FMN-dependent dehydrogenase
MLGRGETVTSVPSTIAELQQLAEKVMSPEHRLFVGRGSFGDWTRDRNRAKLDEISLNPRLLRDTTGRDLSTTVLGDRISFPVMCGAAGAQCASHPEGELATARAAGTSETLMALPVGSGYTIEEVSEAATGPIWFQHIHYSDAVSEIFLPRLKPAGYSAVVLTVDALGPFDLDKKLPGHGGSIKGKMFGSLRGHDELLNEHGMARWVPPNMTWDRLDWLRSLSGGLPLVIKGIRNVEDAQLCVEHGADGIVVSNHGGRQFDGGRSSIEILPEVADAVGDGLEVYLDSGVRSGLDVLRAMALGARAVFVGRPVHWGLAFGGEAGVSLALEILRAEFDRVLAFSGCRSVGEIGREHVLVGTAGATKGD